ncbi:beta-ketoacyl-ACP synthase III [Alcaligenes faecalis subsp. faecalis]|uniref:beta-ketoacyl-ACP synthase III n=1 Tax=Alcaligenes faecalis TaxID=511 RepID=UPI001F18E76F|nr:beta-ketoacyl-ACP synthase III [Alcaligenes faecalis]MBW4788958.1 beta-ketoacyl-ACP synthase III [Alcaligenes faecalis subsp. faecalis]
MPVAFEHVVIHQAQWFMPGEPVDNTAMDNFIAPLNRISGRIKQRILAENGIQQRYYAIGEDGSTRWSNTAMAANAIRSCLEQAGLDMGDIGLLASGSSGGDLLMPGFANAIQGELAAPPLEVHSVHGICAAGVTALQTVAQGIELGAHRHGMAVASEMPSRLFRRSRFASQDYQADFDAHFLRWMLSDGAGAALLSHQDQVLPTTQPGVRLRLRWIHQKSFSGDYPVCMQLGAARDSTRSHLDYDSWADAEQAGALSLRQDIRLLPHLFDIGIHEYVKLVRDGWVDPERISHFLCHYSSEKFIPVVADLLEQAGLGIPAERWYSNLRWRGNTGAASILIMLAEFMRDRTLTPGEQILCYVPESGRFMTAYMLLEVEACDAPAPAVSYPSAKQTVAASSDQVDIAPPHDPATAPQGLRDLLTQLAPIWHGYRSQVWRTPLLRSLHDGSIRMQDYQKWMADWIPQVREGAKWMREACDSLSPAYAPLAELIRLHAGEEQDDFKILFEDYQHAGGTATEIEQLSRNPGGQALNSYLHALAASQDPIGLLGAIYMIEGTGQRIVPALLPLLKSSLSLEPNMYRFLHYHGMNDEHHLARWLVAVELALDCDETGRAEQIIIETARRTAALYLMQFQYAKEF